MYPWQHDMVWREGCKTGSMMSGRTWGLFGVPRRRQTRFGCGGGCVCGSVVKVEWSSGGRATSTNLAVQGPKEKGLGLVAGVLG